jgi:hypothetical protein
VEEVIGYLKEKSSTWIAQNVKREARNFLGHKFWARGARGYFVSTIGQNKEMTCAYIKNPEMADNLQLKPASPQSPISCPRVLHNRLWRFPFKPPALLGVIDFKPPKGKSTTAGLIGMPPPLVPFFDPRVPNCNFSGMSQCRDRGPDINSSIVS